MKINKVSLKNYRVHSELSVEFDEKINLLLGQNGAGKSSVLEAIGYALFDADIRSSQKDAIRYGEKSALISVEINGNDGNQYIIERKLGNGQYHRLYMEGEESARIEGKDEVISKVKELSGIVSNEKNIYQNIITASQNKITNVFSETPANREKIFNQIFDTAVYREIYDNYLKDYRDDIKFQINSKNEILKDYKSKLSDITVVKKDLKDIKSKHRDKENEISSLNKELSNFETQKNKYEKYKNLIDLNNKELSHTDELKRQSNVAIEKIDQSIVDSENALKIVCENKNIYDEYNIKNSDYKKLSDQIKNLEKIKSELDDLHIKKLENQKLKQTEEGNLLLYSEQMKKIDVDQEKLSIELNSLMEEKNQIGIKIDNLKEYGITKRKNLDAIQLKLDSLNSVKRNIDERRVKLDFENNLLKKYNAVDEKLKDAKEKKEELASKIIEFKNLKELHQKENISLNELEKVNLDLDDGLCPFFKEKCKNINDKISFSEYFEIRKDRILKSISDIDRKLSSFGDLESENTNIYTTINLLENDKSEINNHLKNIELLESEIESLLKKFDKEKLEINKYLSELNLSENNISLFDKEEYEFFITELNNEIVELRETLKNNNEKNSDLISKIEICKSNNEKFNSDKQLLEKKLNDTNVKIDKKQSEIKFAEEKIEILKVQSEGLANLKDIAANMYNEIQSLLPGYKIYIENLNKSSELENLKKEKDKLYKNRESLNQKTVQLVCELKKLNEQFLESEYLSCLNNIKEIKVIINEKQKDLTELFAKIALLDKEMELCTKLQNDIKNIYDKIKIIEKKLTIVEDFRNNLNGMGKLVASRFLKKIEIKGTENFRKITGRNETIKWINNYDESYSVFLCKGNEAVDYKKFEVLSGGEQVAVAISLRSAMASFLTSAGFAIFDEPTINLDMERKYALAESLKEIFSNLEQAIIVTHDDTFREMAQKTIVIK